MSRYIITQAVGNGTVSVTDYNPEVGDQVICLATPDVGASLVDLTFQDIETMQYLAYPAQQEVIFNMPDCDILIVGTFTGGGPEPPEPPTSNVPIWLLFKAANKWRCK